MRKRTERTVKELYDLTKRISKPEITPILKGICRIQGPVDDLDLKNHQGTNSDEKKFMFPKDRVAKGIETGSCTVCSAPCSLCMHYNGESSFSCNLSIRTEADSSSVINADVMPIYKSRICNELQPAASETNNLLSTSSSHDDSCSENAESKTCLRYFMALDASVGVDTPQMLSSGEVVEEEHSFRGGQSLHSKMAGSFLSGESEGQSELECHGENILCTTGAGDPNVVVSDSIADIEKKGVECSEKMIDGFVGANNHVVQVEASDDKQGHEIGESHCIIVGSNATLVLLANPLNDVSHVNSHINDVSPKTSFLSRRSQDENPSFVEDGSMVSEVMLNMQPQVEIQKCEEIDDADCPLASLIVGNSVKNEFSSISNHEVLKTSRAKSEFSAGTSNIDSLCQDFKLDTECKNTSDHCSEECNVNDTERDDAVLDATKGEYEHMQPQADGAGENSESDVVLDDVKVCDICGDAGREDYLAICSRCSDGAEHTYCMREMLDKVPDGEWLCEECKINETRNQNVKEDETVHGFMSTLIPVQKQVHILDARVSAKKRQGTSILNRRQHHVGDRKVSELSSAYIDIASPRKKPALSHQISSKNQDMKQVKTASMEPSSEVQPTKCSKPFARSKTYLSSGSFKGLAPLYSPCGKFSRSVSFNSLNANPKVKTLIENAPHKQINTRERTTNSLRKEDSFKSSSKTSFKSSSLECCNVELAGKNPSLLSPRVEVLRTLKEVKERNMVEKKSLAKGSSFARPSASNSSNYPSKVDVKFAQNDEIQNNVSETSVHSSSKGLVANDLGSNEEKKPISYSTKNIESSSCNYDLDNPMGFKLSKESIQRSISIVDGSFRKAEITSTPSAVQPLESVHKDNRARDSASFMGLRLSAVGTSRTFHSQGNKMRGATQEKVGGSAYKSSSTEHNSREVVKNGNKWQEVVNAAMSRSEMLKGEKSITLDELRATLIRTPLAVDSGISKASSEDSTNVSTKTLPALCSEQLAALPAEASVNGTKGTPIASELDAKYMAKTFENGASMLSNSLSGSAVPKLECIWQGSFNVLGPGSQTKLFFGIQAHLSTCASQRVLQLATKVPSNVQLEEVSRMSLWPSQLPRTSPRDENIALFFFAKDIQSYENSYRKLIEKMQRNDLALKGNVDGTELLIFSSNKLPINSQRWNRMHYLWGTFRSKKRYCLPVMGEQKKPLSSNQEYILPPIAGVVSNAQTLRTTSISKKLSDSISSKGLPRESSNGVDFHLISLDGKDMACKNPETATPQNLLNQVPALPEVIRELPSLSARSSSGMKMEALKIINTFKSRLQMPTAKSSCEEENNGFSQEKIVSDCPKINPDDSTALIYDNGVEYMHRKATSVPSVSPNCSSGADCINIEEKNGEKETSPSPVTVTENVQRRNVLGADILRCESTAITKHESTCSTESASQHSGEISGNIFETAVKRERPSWLPVEHESEKKKTCHLSRSYIIDDNISTPSSSKQHSLYSGILKQQQSGERQENLGLETTERCFFPIDLDTMQNDNCANIRHFPSSKEEEMLESSSPDLELALGGKSNATKPFPFPSALNSVGGKQSLQHCLLGDGDDASASLSLSL